jgi:DNA-binding NtrC family response regulator
VSTLIAIYDDDASIREVLCELLELEGFRAVACTSVLQLHQAAVDGARLAIADTWGPSHLSLEHQEREQIQALARLVPTILISGRDWTARMAAAELGLVALVQKPFNVDDLLGHVQRSTGGPWVVPLLRERPRAGIEPQA